MTTSVTIESGPFGARVRAVRDELRGRAAVQRLLERDHTLWQDDPTEVADRLGWLDAPAAAERLADDLSSLGETLRADGMRRALVCGMGGSSLFPEVIARSFDAGGLELSVLDSTHPAAVRRAVEDLSDTVVIVSSKSGTTIETRSQLAAVLAAGADPTRQLIAITDPGSELQRFATEHAFRHVETAPPDVGGRFSALTAFGLLPAALAGVDVAALGASGRSVLTGLEASGDEHDTVTAAALLVAAAREGNDCLQLLLPPSIAALGGWIEQLVAESTGKAGHGLLPVRSGRLDVDCVSVRTGDGVTTAPGIAIDFDGDPHELGGLVVWWEVVTALVGAAMGINPFDQPDVASAKAASQSALDDRRFDLPVEPLDAVLARTAEGDAVTVLAFVDPASPVGAGLDDLAVALAERTGGLVTTGLGPRYLHSTGQLHKGGPDRHTFVIACDAGDEDLEVPERGFTFGELFRAQAAGDLAALRDAGRRVGAVAVADLEAVLHGAG